MADGGSSDNGKGAERMAESVRAMFGAIDKMDVPGLLSHLAPDVLFQFGANEPVTGRERVGEIVSGVFAGLRGISHEFIGLWQFDDVTVCQLVTTYGLPDGRTKSLPAAVIVRQQPDGLVDDYRIYQDVSPLWSAP